MKHIKLFENFTEESSLSDINEGFVAITLGAIAAMSIIRYLLKIVKGIKFYKKLTNTLLGMTRFNASVGYGRRNLETGSIDKQEALEVIEYDDRYFLTFKGPFKGPVDNIRVLKNERILLIDLNNDMVKIPLSPDHYNEFISIVKNKLSR